MEHDHHHGALHARIPTFLCPALLRTPLSAPARTATRPRPSSAFSTFRHSRQEATSTVPQESHHDAPSQNDISVPSPRVPQSLPRACPGCGAPAQTYDKDEAGYYDLDRRHVKAYLNYNPEQVDVKKSEDDIYTTVLKNADPKLLEELGLAPETLDAPKAAAQEAGPPPTPICDRCHNLVHHHTGVPIHHPSVDAIRETIAESPHRRNHIYHVLDAADFPLSLVPNLQSSLRLPKLRTQNRRAKHKGWVGENRIAQVSFIITRADLLAPLKEQVDKLLPYMQDVLRDALGRVNENARLGNVHLVSAKRGWWTKKVKEDIWDRGGAGWMVGKVNVGKSNLFEVVFPKGRGADYVNITHVRTEAERQTMLQDAAAKSATELLRVQKELAEEDAEIERRRRQPVLEPEEELPEEEDYTDDNALLPPRQPYTPFPVLPLASSLPGTTASPIRIPFGRNRGELIDLPGLARTNPDLSTFVKPEERDQLIMTHRVTPERLTLKPGQSLVLGGGLIRITPTNPDLVYLVHAFVPLHPHVTATEKAIALQAQERVLPNKSILAPHVGPKIQSAGTFKLKWDATKQLAGPLTDAVAGKMKPENLPFTIWSADILVEGVGWIEVSAQVRKPRGWKPVGIVKKDPNHKKIEKEQRLAEERERRAEKYRAKLEAESKAGSGGGDAFDRAGITGLSDRHRGGNSTQELRERAEKERDLSEKEQKRKDALDFVGEFVDPHPEIEVFTPLGKYVGVRRPLCGSVLGGRKYVSSRERSVRPRRAMAPIRRKQMAVRKDLRRQTSG